MLHCTCKLMCPLFGFEWNKVLYCIVLYIFLTYVSIHLYTFIGRDYVNLKSDPVCFINKASKSCFCFLFWGYLTKGLLKHLSQSILGTSFILVWLGTQVRICSWNQPVLSNEGKVSSSRNITGTFVIYTQSIVSVVIFATTGFVSWFWIYVIHINRHM